MAIETQARERDAQGRTQYERLHANCKKIWGANKEFDFEVEADHYIYYQAHVKEDWGSSFSGALTMTGVCNSRDAAWNELDRMLDLWARQVESGQPMTRETALELFSGPNRRQENVLKQFMDEKAWREGAAARNKRPR